MIVASVREHQHLDYVYMLFFRHVQQKWDMLDSTETPQALLQQLYAVRRILLIFSGSYIAWLLILSHYD